MSRNGTGAWRLAHHTKRIPMVINSNHTTTKKENDPDTLQVVTADHLTWDHEDPIESHVPHNQSSIIYYNITYGPQLDLHPVPLQYHTHHRDLKKLPHHIIRHITDGRTMTHKVGR